MKNTATVTKRVLSFMLSLALIVTSLVFFNIGSLTAAAATSSDVINVADKLMEDKVYFYVPEQVYLKPSLTAHKNQERANFQWFVDAEIDKSTHEISKLNTGEKSSGNLYFYYENASSVSITFKYLNADFTVMKAYTSTADSISTENYANMNSTIKFSTLGTAISAVNTRTDTSRTRYSINSNVVDTTITSDCMSPYLLSTETGCYIEWTATYVDSLDGLTKTAVAYTYIYKPNIMPAGNAMFIKNDRGMDHDNSALSWISGYHSLDYYNVGKYYPVVGQGNNRSILPFSSTNPEGYKVMSNSYNKDTDQYAQWAAYPMTNGYFAWDGTQIDDVDANYFVTDNMSNTIFTMPSFNLIENRNEGPSGGDVTFLNYGVSPQTILTVDTSRYSDLSLIPNLTVGLMSTSSWSESGAITGAWIVSDVKNSYGNDHYTSQLNTTSEGEARWYNYNSIIASGEDPYNPTGEGATEGIKYNGKIKKSISGLSSSADCNIQASLYNEQGNDTGFNISILRLRVNGNNKATLRDAFNRANEVTAGLGRNGSTSPYYDTTSAAWTKYINLTKAAGQFLANLDTMTSISVSGTSYSAESLGNALNSAIDALENIRYSSQATVSVASFEKNADGDYIIKSVFDSSENDIATSYFAEYKYGSDITFNAPEYEGYSFVGYATGKKADIGAVVENSYSSMIEGEESSIAKTRVAENYLSYTFFYVPAEVTSIVDTNDGVFNYLRAKISDMPAELGSITYPSYREHADSDTDFNYDIEGNDITVWSTENTTAVQMQYLPFYAVLESSTEYKLTYDVTGTDPENIEFTFYNSKFNGGNGVDSSTYLITESGQTFTTNTIDSGTVYLRLEFNGDARNGKTFRISDICLSKADTNELVFDTTQGYPAVYSAPAGTKTAVSYTANGTSSLITTTSYSTLMYEQYQLLPYYVDIQPNSTYMFTYELTGLSSDQVSFELYNSSYVAGNGSSLHYYNLTGDGVTFTTGPNDDAVGQLMIRFSRDPSVSSGAKATIKNLNVVNVDSKTTITGLYNESTDLSIPVKEGYKFCGWKAKSNAGGSAHGTVKELYSNQVCSYTFGTNIDIIEAQWEADTCKVIFREVDGTVVSEQDIIYGNAAATPSEEPELFGHTFAGWDTDYSKVTKNLIIEPVYTEKDIEVTVTADDSEIFAGAQTNVSAMFEPNEPEISAVEWKSNNDNIATVDSNGVVTGVASGTATITGTITYDGRTYSASTTVKVNPVEVTSVAVNTMPDKVTYYTGDTFDPAGLSLTVTYNNGTTEVVSGGITFNSVNTATAGSKTVRATYAGKTATFRITVIELTIERIEIVQLPDVLDYYVGDQELDTLGIKVEAVYNNGTREEISEDDLYFEGFDTSAAGEVQIKVYYEDFEASYNITVIALDVIGIVVKTPPEKTTYFTGETADYTGLSLTVTYSNGVTATVTDGYTVTGFDSLTAGTKTLTVEYEGKTATFTVTVKAIELESIEIATPAEKLEYFVGEEADFTGLTIKANYNNGTTNTLADGFNVTGFDSLTAGQQTITVEFGGKTTTFKVTVKAIELVSIEIATPAEKLEYFTGEDADFTGLTIKANYNNGTTAIVEGYNVTGFDSLTAGQKTITVEFEGKTVTFTVTVKAIVIEKLEIVTNPDKTDYYVNDAFDATGLTLKATYNNGATEMITDGYVLGTVDMTTAGSKTVEVTYEGKTVSFNITVTALYITNVEIATNPEKTEYIIGEEADYVGLTLKVTYNDGSTKTISEGFAVDGFDSSAKGTVTLMVSYEGYYMTFDVTVLGNADWSKIEALLAEFKALDPSLYTNYDEVYYTYVYPFENDTLPLAKAVYVSEKDQAEVDTLYAELKGYVDMLVLVEVNVPRFEIVGGASVKTQSGVNYIVGTQASLTKAKFQSTYADYENVKLEYEMTTSRYLGTGSKLTVKSTETGEVIGEYVFVIYGDVDGSATINSRDALAVSNSAAGTTATLTGAAKLAANVEGTRAQINDKDIAVLYAVAGGSMVIDQTTGKGVKA